MPLPVYAALSRSWFSLLRESRPLVWAVVGEGVPVVVSVIIRNTEPSRWQKKLYSQCQTKATKLYKQSDGAGNRSLSQEVYQRWLLVQMCDSR